MEELETLESTECPECPGPPPEFRLPPPPRPPFLTEGTFCSEAPLAELEDCVAIPKEIEVVAVSKGGSWWWWLLKGWLTGWLVGWLVSWLVGWLVGDAIRRANENSGTRKAFIRRNTMGSATTTVTTPTRCISSGKFSGKSKSEKQPTELDGFYHKLRPPSPPVPSTVPAPSRKDVYPPWVEINATSNSVDATT
ncbi:hypothetical protein M0804_012114 [Polistes exclamans]|nr:hypothetical protein M0804_012114 [Polistes exclamans]